jgi:hypothetical protein
MSFQPIAILRIFEGFTWHYLFKKSIRCANILAEFIAERNILSPLCLLPKTSPLNLAVASGNGNRIFTQKLHVQIQITLNRHSPRLMPNDCLLPNPPYFSLLSTFKDTLVRLMCHQSSFLFGCLHFWS